MPLRQFTTHENWVIQQAYNRLQIRPTIPNPSSDTYLRLDPVTDKGQGYFASRNITRGTCILEESPFLQIRRNGREVKPQHSAHINREVGGMVEANRVLFDGLSPPDGGNYLRFKRNAFDLSEAGRPTFYVSGVFEHASFFNHSCVPNAHFTWNPDRGQDNQGRLTVYAIRDIAFGEEVLVNYRIDCSYEARAVRVRKLSKDYDFVCTCPACDTQSPTAVQSDSNWQRMKEIVKNRQFGGQDPTPDQRLAELTELNELLGVVNTEGIVFPQQADTYGWLAEWYAREVAQAESPVTTREISRRLGLEAAEKKLAIEILCSGDRSAKVEEALNLIARIS